MTDDEVLESLEREFDDETFPTLIRTYHDRSDLALVLLLIVVTIVVRIA